MFGEGLVDDLGIPDEAMLVGVLVDELGKSNKAMFAGFLVGDL